MTTAHLTERVGVYAELIAEAALIASGWLGVARPTTDEYYDLTAIDRLTGEHKTFQVKTLKRREDRGDNLVLFAKKGDGKPYSLEESADYYLGVLIDDGEVPRVFAMENRNISEYWAKETSASERWVELPVALDREELAEESEEGEAEPENKPENKFEGERVV